MVGDWLYAKTQRIVLLIDLNPLLLTPTPEQYLAVVISAAEKLLSFPPLSASLFSFKFLVSSLSSLLSSSKLSALSIPSSKLSFDLPGPTLVSLRRAVDAVKRCELQSNSTAAASPRGVNAWEPVVRDPEIGMIPGFTDGGGIDVVRSNLVLMFSPVSRDLNSVSEFLDVKSGDECLFKSKLGEIFDCVNDLFDDRDIHLCWIDVRFGERSELGLKSGFFDSGVREWGWGLCSTDSIIYGSSIVPFGLIYPTIGVSPKLSTSRKFTVQASLEIVDTDGKPMECKCGELEFSSSEISSGKRCDEFCNGITKLSIQASESSEKGIESEEIDLAALAERLVKSCLLHSSQRLEKDYSCESGTLLLVNEELTKMLLKKPKDLVAKFKTKHSSSTESEQKSDEASSPSSIIREYSFCSILFRMEILRSEIGSGSEESVTQKFAKQICMLLEAIQCKLDGGFFSDWSLDKYVDKIIRARYHHVLGGAVNIIYTEMDLLMFSDEDLEDSFMNNEDSSQSGRENINRNAKSHHRCQRSKDVPGTSKKTFLQKDTKECREAKRVIEAQEMRERARRFSSFTSWMPDLCRVWAPKQGKNSKEKNKDQWNMTVCETPVTADNKRTRTDDTYEHECGTLPRSSVPKALFQDDF
ncbi:hypothetical protein Bca4012_024950 [Brassica carinata]